MTATFTASTYEAIPEGIYGAQLVSIEKLPSEAFGEFLKWSFNLRLSDGSVGEISGASSTATGPKSKGYKWATALLGHAPVAGAAEELAGRTCQLHIIVNEDGFNRIEAVMPAKAGAAVAPAPVADDSPPRRLEKATEDEPAAALPF